MDFQFIMVLLALAILSMGIFTTMPAHQQHAYQVSVLKRLRRALCGLLGFIFIATGGCIFLGHFGIIEQETASQAALSAAILFGAFIVDMLRFKSQKQPSNN